MLLPLESARGGSVISRLVMGKMRSRAYLSGFLAATCVLALGNGALARAQEPLAPPPQQPDNPADAAPPPAAKKTPPKTNKDNAAESAPDQPTWDPLRAEKDL